jgi:hypothetical protein
MATKLENLALEVAHFNNFKQFIPKFDLMCKETIELLSEVGLLQVSTGFEYAIATVGGFTVISTNEADISDGSDAKLSSVRTSGYGRSYTAPVTNLYNKTGALRVQVYERKQDKFYYFVIPHAAYQHIPRKSNIEIPFEMNGTPRKRSSRPVYRNWWNYEVESFDLLCA